MAFIDSSTDSPLAKVSTMAEPELDEREAEAMPEDEAAEEEGDGEERTGTLVENLIAQIDDINLARTLDDQTLNEIGMAVVAEFDLDENSRSEWLDKAQTAMRFALQETEEKQYPWPKASNIIFPLIGQAALEFGSRTYPALIQGRNVVKGCVWGSDRGTPVTMDGKPDGEPQMMPAPLGPDGQPQGEPQPVWLVAPGEKRQRADRIGEHMSFQLLEEMPEWEPQTDQLLHQIPIIGGAARKTYRDPAEERNYSLFVSLTNLVWDYNAASFEAAPRHSEMLTLYPHEIIERERTGAEEDEDGALDEGMFLHIDYGPGGGDTSGQLKRADGDTIEQSAADPDAPHLFIEQHRRWDLDGDGYPEPYVVTVHRQTSKVVRIVARYDADGIRATSDGDTIKSIAPVEHYTLIPFLPNIDGGSYPMGFGHLLRPLNEAINTTLNQMFDAGHLQNAGGGFIGDGLGMASGTVNFQVGKYVRVNTKGQSIRENVFPLPFQGPSPVLFQLLGVLMTSGKELASIQNILTGDAAIANAPPTTVLALIEQGLKVYTAIHKRIYRAFKSEFAKLYRLNRVYVKEPQRYQIGDEWREIHPDDYRLGGGVEPVADPTMVTDMQRLARAQVLMLFKDDPQIDQKEIKTRLFEAANVDHIDRLFVPENAQAAQFAAEMADLQKAQAMAELGRTRAAEQKDATQAYLNLATARAKASGPERDYIEHQIEMVRIRLEAINTNLRAAEIDHKFNDSGSRREIERAQLAPPAGPVPEAAA